MAHSLAKHKRYEEICAFLDIWVDKYFFIEYKGLPKCLICKKELSINKDYNVRRHYLTKRTNYISLEGNNRTEAIEKFKKQNSQTISTFFTKKKEGEINVQASYIVSQKLAKYMKPFTEGEFIKECMIEVADLICQKKVMCFVKLVFHDI